MSRHGSANDRRRLSRAAVILCLAGLTATSVGTAYAYWTTTGAGSGSGSAGDGLVALTTTATVAPGALLYPGGTAALNLDVSNANDVAVAVTALALDPDRGVEVDAAHEAGCTVSDLSVATPSGWAGITVQANSSSDVVTIANAVAMGGNASSGCQGATFTIPVILTGQSS